MNRIDAFDQCKIVIVDNDMTDQENLINAVRQIAPNASITSLYDGCEAIDYLFNKTAPRGEAQQPDLIFIELDMPKISGKIIINILRKQAHLSHVPIIMLSRQHTGAEGRELLKLGANGFFSKTTSEKDLQRIVGQLRIAS